MVTSLADVPPHVVAPSGVQLKQSGVSDNETGAWCTEKVSQGNKFGPFVGRTLQKGKAKKVDYRYAWEVLDPETNELTHVVDATDPQHGNWMRYVNCARYLEEQNLVSIQEGLDIYYRAIRDIVPGEELLTWYSKEEASTKQRKQKETAIDTSTAVTPPKIRKKPGPKPKVKDVTSVEKSQSKPAKAKTLKSLAGKVSDTQDKQAKKDENVKKRKRKKALSEDYVEGTDLEDLVNLSKKTVKDGLEEGIIKEKKRPVKASSRGRGAMKTGRGSYNKSQILKGAVSPRGRGRGKTKIQNSPSKKSDALNFYKNQMKGSSPVKSSRGKVKVQGSPGRGRGRGKNSNLTGTTSPGKRRANPSTSKDGDVKMSDNLLWLVNEASLNPATPAKDGEYNFDILPVHHITGKLGRKLYKCDICAGIYRHAFSLKRHYLRNHIYCYYLSEADVSNCKILIAQQEAGIKNKPKNLPRKSPAPSTTTENKKAGSSKDKFNDADGITDIKRGKNSLQTRPQPVLYPGLYRCYRCNKLFDYIEDLKAHTHDHPVAPSEKLFSCSQCSMKFSYKQNLMRHQAVHSGIRPYPCKKCNRNFSTATSLKKHEKIHVGKVPKCKYCKAGFNWRVELKRHMQKVHSEYLHHCPYCEKNFLARCAFQRHLTTHEDDPYLEPEIDTPTAPIKQTKKTPKESRKGNKKVTKQKKVSPNTKSPKKKTSPAKQSKTKGAKFKFACTVCKKRFSSYVNMCRHRRLAHPEVPKLNKPEPEKTVDPELMKIEKIKIEENVIEPEEWRPCDAKFFASVADNIAYNLCNHIDGGESSIKEFSSHIRIKDYKSVAEVHDLETKAPTERDQIWTKYNFPSGYEPIISPEEISDGTVVALNLKTEKIDVTIVPKKTKLSTPLLIKIPEFHRCSVCSCVFSNTESFDWHMKDHQQEYHPADAHMKEHQREYHQADANTKDHQWEYHQTDAHMKEHQQDYHQVDAPKDTALYNKEVKQETSSDSDSADVAASYLNPRLVYAHSQKLSETDSDSIVLSPFHKYEEIQFGINGDLKFVCGVCKKEFANTFELGLHQFKKHPTIDCTYLEVENGFSVESLYYPAPIPTGELAEVKKKPIDSRENHSFTCTRCLSHFSTVTRLYIHIINCAPKPKVKSLPGRAKRQFANQRSPVVKNRFQDTEKKGKSMAKLPFEKRQSKDNKHAVRGIHQRKGISMQDSTFSDIFLRRRQQGGLRYNPRNHVRRREMIDVLERHQCNGCGCKFQTISLLERHIKKCEEKEKLKSVKPLKRSSSEQFLPNSKLTCRYCSRQFTYLKFLVNHYRDFCRVKKDKVTKGSLTKEDLQDEDRIKAAALSAANHETERRESSEVAMTADGSAPKRGWPRGVKRKKGRKNHCWTYIKRRKSPEQSALYLQRSLDSGFDPGTPDPSCRLEFDKICEYSDESSEGSKETSTRNSQSYMEAVTSETSSSSLISTDQIPMRNSKPVLKRKKLTLLDFKVKAPKRQETVPFDPSFLPMQQNKSYKQRQSKHHNKTKLSCKPYNTEVKSVYKLQNSHSSLPERLNTLYGLMPKQSTKTSKSVESSSGEKVETTKSLTNERNLSVDSGLGSPQEPQSLSVNRKDRCEFSDTSGFISVNNNDNINKGMDETPIQQSEPVSTNGEKITFTDIGTFNGQTNSKTKDAIDPVSANGCKKTMKKVTKESSDTKPSTTKVQANIVADTNDSADKEPFPANGEKNKVKTDLKGPCKTPLTHPTDGQKITAQENLEEANSSDEDNMVLQRLVDLKSKSRGDCDTTPASDLVKLPPTDETSSSKTTKIVDVKSKTECETTTTSDSAKLPSTDVSKLPSTDETLSSTTTKVVDVKSKTECETTTTSDILKSPSMDETSSSKTTKVVDVKSKTECETTTTSDSVKLPSKVDISSPLMTQKRKMIQPTLLNMFSSKKSAKSKSKLFIPTNTNTVTDKESHKSENKTEKLKESHKMLESSKSANKSSSIQSLNSSHEIPDDNSNSCSFESVTSR